MVITLVRGILWQMQIANIAESRTLELVMLRCAHVRASLMQSPTLFYLGTVQRLITNRGQVEHYNLPLNICPAHP